MPCSSGCATQDHGSFGACMRAKGLRVNWRSDAARERKWNSEITRAKSLMREGHMPDNTFGPALDKAERYQEKTGGLTYRADDPTRHVTQGLEIAS